MPSLKKPPPHKKPQPTHSNSKSSKRGSTKVQLRSNQLSNGHRSSSSISAASHQRRTKQSSTSRPKDK